MLMCNIREAMQKEPQCGDDNGHGQRYEVCQECQAGLVSCDRVQYWVGGLT